MVKYKDEDLIGRRFGKLVVLNLFSKKENSGRTGRYAHCKCDCGREKEIRLDALLRGDVISCTCYSRKKSSVRIKNFATTHGLSHHLLYNVWEKIVDRCENPKHNSYKDYGGRGIKICNDWRKHPDNFINFALENGWEKDLTVDRIDVNGNYEPKNVRFVNRHTQSANQRKSIKNKSGYVGVTWDKSRDKWVSWISINKKTHNLGRFDNKKEALEARNDYIVKNKLFEYPIQDWKGE